MTDSKYKFIVKNFVKAIQWDLRSEANRSKRILRKLRGSQKTRKAVIMCNGPSLLKTDFDLLQRSEAFVIGLNKINLLYDKTTLRPDAIVAVNRHVIEQNAEFYNETPTSLFLSYMNYVSLKCVRTRENIIHLYTRDSGMGPQEDMINGVHEGCTVTTVALQLALHIGCRKIALVGCDHNFTTNGKPHLEVRAEDEDPNHFDNRYFSRGMKWQLPDLLGSEISYLRVRYLAEKLGVSIFNATEGGKLECFQRSSLEEFLQCP